MVEYDRPLSVTFAALADPTRRAILARLATGEASVTELAEPFDMSLPASPTPQSPRARRPDRAQPRRAVASLPASRPRGSKRSSDWLDHYRHFWEESFDRLDEYLRELKKTKEKKHERQQRKK